MRSGLARGVALGGVLVAWAVVTYGNRRLGITNPVLLPTPGDVWAVALDGLRDGSLLRHGATSLLRVLEGFGLAAGAALALGLLAGLCTSLRLAVEPILEFVRPIPPLAFLPMFLVWFGLGEASKVAFIGYTTFFPMFVAIASSLLRVDVMLLRAAASHAPTTAALARRVRAAGESRPLTRGSRSRDTQRC